MNSNPMRISFTPQAWEDYLYWQKTDRRILKKINRLIQGIQRTPREGEGKPEELRGNLRRHWSRRITQEHRIVYVIHNDHIEIRACRFHYDKG